MVSATETISNRTIRTLRHEVGTYALEECVDPDGDPANLFTLRLEDGRRWVLKVFRSQEEPAELLRSLIDEFGFTVRRRLAPVYAEKCLPRLMDYIEKVLSEQDRTNELESGLYPHRDVERAIATALERKDPFRAAMAFEHCFHTLRADVRLVHIMEAIIADFDKKRAKAKKEIAAIADEVESLERRVNKHRKAMIAAWHRQNEVDAEPHESAALLARKK